MEESDFLDYRFAYAYIKTAINAFFLLSGKIKVFGLVFHLIFALRALEKKHFGLS